MALTFHFRPDIAPSANVDDYYVNAAGADATIAGGYVVVASAAVVKRVWGPAASYTHGIAGFEGVNVTRATGLQRILVFFASGDINKPQLTVTIETNGDLKAYIGSTGAPLATYTYAAGIADGVPHKYEAELLCHSSAGSFAVRLDGVPVLSASGINTNPQATGNFNGWLMSAFSGSAFNFRDHYLLDAATSPNTAFVFTPGGEGECPAWALAANGYANEWSASGTPHYSQINGAFDINKWVLSTAPAQSEAYVLGNDPYPTSPRIVLGVQLNWLLVANAGAVLTPFVRRAGVNYSLPALTGLSTAVRSLRFSETDVDPTTGNPWVQSELTDGTLEFGFEETVAAVRVYQFFVQPLIVPSAAGSLSAQFTLTATASVTSYGTAQLTATFNLDVTLPVAPRVPVIPLFSPANYTRSGGTLTFTDQPTEVDYKVVAHYGNPVTGSGHDHDYETKTWTDPADRTWALTAEPLAGDLRVYAQQPADPVLWVVYGTAGSYKVRRRAVSFRTGADLGWTSDPVTGFVGGADESMRFMRCMSDDQTGPAYIATVTAAMVPRLYKCDGTTLTLLWTGSGDTPRSLWIEANGTTIWMLLALGGVYRSLDGGVTFASFFTGHLLGYDTSPNAGNGEATAMAIDEDLQMAFVQHAKLLTDPDFDHSPPTAGGFPRERAWSHSAASGPRGSFIAADVITRSISPNSNFGTLFGGSLSLSPYRGSKVLVGTWANGGGGNTSGYSNNPARAINNRLGQFTISGENPGGGLDSRLQTAAYFTQGLSDGNHVLLVKQTHRDIWYSADFGMTYLLSAFQLPANLDDEGFLPPSISYRKPWALVGGYADVSIALTQDYGVTFSLLPTPQATRLVCWADGT